MGAALWVAAGLAAFFAARIVHLRRTGRWATELAAAAVAALMLGVLATALDFGGWNDADWRAVVFVFLGSAAAIGVVRALRS